MKSYLVLYVDIEYIAATIFEKGGNYYPILTCDQNLLWLYFCKDQNKHTVSYGREYKKHYYDGEPGFFGNFLNKLLDNSSEVLIDGINKPYIDFLESADILKLFTDKYNKSDPDFHDSVPTLISFSSSVKEKPRQIMVDYLNTKGFSVECNSMPLSELVCRYYWKKNRINPKEGSEVLLLEATNSFIYLVKHNFYNRYFLREDSTTESYPGKGYDPRKRAVIYYVLSEAGKSLHLIRSTEESEEDYERLEPEAEKWLKSIDTAENGSPLSVDQIWLSPDPSKKLDISLEKEELEKVTDFLVNEIRDIYKAFESKVVEDKSSLSSVILFGRCFTDKLLRKAFSGLIDEELIIVSDLDYNEFLGTYPQIDFKYYTDPKERRAIQEKGEIKKRYARTITLADEFFSKNNWDQAEGFYRKGLSIRPGDTFCLDQIEKIKECRLKNPLGKEEINIRRKEKDQMDDDYVQNTEGLIVEVDNPEKQGKSGGEFMQSDQESQVMSEKRKGEQEELRKAEEEENEHISVLRENEERNNEYMQKALELYSDGALDEAERKCILALAIKPGNEKSITLLGTIRARKQELNEKEEKERDSSEYLQKAYESLSKGALEEAERYYNLALGIKQDDKKIHSLLERIKNAQKEKQEKEEELRYNENIKRAYELFYTKKLTEAEKYCNLALEGRPNDGDCLSLLKRISQRKEISRANRKKLTVMTSIVLPILILIFVTVFHFSSNQNKIIKSISQPGKDSTNKVVLKESPGDKIVNDKKPDEADTRTKISPEVTQDRTDKLRPQKQPEAQNQVSELTFSNGNYYRGEVKDGKMNGFGAYTFVTGKKVDGNGLEDVEPEAGDYIKGNWINGDLYTGELFSKNNTSIRKLRPGKI